MQKGWLALQRRPPGGSWREATEGECEYIGSRAFHPNGQPHRFARQAPSVAARNLLADIFPSGDAFIARIRSDTHPPKNDSVG